MHMKTNTLIHEDACVSKKVKKVTKNKKKCTDKIMRHLYWTHVLG